MKVGLEIHQQLNTHKLFCKCESKLSENVKFKVKRYLHPVAGESGKIDIAAEFEKAKRKYYIYEITDNSCLVELDEEPPHLINEEALKIALDIAESLNMQVLPIIQVMRKTVVDGSNTSGFQRTLLLAVNGYVEIDGKKIRIETLCLEEDAARKIEEKGNHIVYRLDRLGIPLVEITTAPDIDNPELARKVAEKIGLILRLTGKVKRGLGTIRQDINVSIPEGEKIEIKGVQELKLIPEIVKNEVERQKKLLEWQKEVKKRGIDGIKLEIEL